jgi:hypothetical protein
MDPAWLRSLLEKEGLHVKQAGYFGKFSVWLENEQEKTFAVRLFKKVVWIAGKVITKIVPIESKLLSPYIVLEASKSV